MVPLLLTLASKGAKPESRSQYTVSADYLSWWTVKAQKEAEDALLLASASASRQKKKRGVDPDQEQETQEPSKADRPDNGDVADMDLTDDTPYQGPVGGKRKKQHLNPPPPPPPHPIHRLQLHLLPLACFTSNTIHTSRGVRVSSVQQ